MLRRAIDKWLKAGVFEEGSVHRADEGSPQGGVVSPLLANIYLHEVLDMWFATDVGAPPAGEGIHGPLRGRRGHRPRLRRRRATGHGSACRKRFARYGLTLHPEKTRLVNFRRPRGPQPSTGPSVGSFDMLGFTWYWGESRKGNPIVRRKTSSSRFRRALGRIAELVPPAAARANRHSAR